MSKTQSKNSKLVATTKKWHNERKLQAARKVAMEEVKEVMKKPTADEIISTMKMVPKNKASVFAQTGPIIDLRQKPHEAMDLLKSKQTQNYNDRLRALKQRENKLVKQGNKKALAQVQQTRRIYAREQRRFNLTYAQVWMLFGPVFERWEKHG